MLRSKEAAKAERIAEVEQNGYPGNDSPYERWLV